MVSCHKRVFSFSLGVTRIDRLRNEYIRGSAHVKCFGNKAREARLRWFEHVQRGVNEYVGRRFELPGKIDLDEDKEEIYGCGER